MKSTLQFIHDDHKNYSVLLSLLDHDIKNLQKGEQTDFIRLYDIMNYMTNYPDVHHHPAEEIIFALLEKKSPSTGDSVATLIKEHRKLAELGRALKEKLHHVTSGAIVSKDEIISTTKDYYTLLTNHLNFEEGELLPLVEEVFDENDWSSIAQQIKKTEDPLFGDVVDTQFTDLLGRIADFKTSN